MMDEETPKPKRRFEIGQPLDTLSVADLGETIELLQGEIARLEAARRAKSAAIGAAQALFRKP
jgi:uncharacterized small protein (DUF1192 family)